MHRHSQWKSKADCRWFIKKDRGDFASENFVSEQDSRFYADMYRKSGIKGGHIILLNSVDSEYYEDTKEQAVMAL